MSSPFSSAELQDLISKLHRLEQWQREVESQRGNQPAKGGYTRGDPKARARAAGPVGAQQGFPGIPQLAALWKLEEEAGPEFSGPAFGSVEEGPGPPARSV